MTTLGTMISGNIAFAKARGLLKQLNFNPVIEAVAIVVTKTHLDVESTLVVFWIQRWLAIDVTDVYRWTRQQPNTPMDAGVPPLILILYITGVTPVQHLDGDHVVAGLKIVRQIEFGRQPAVLGEPDFHAVAVEVVAIFDASQPDDRPMAEPCFR